MKRSQSLSSHPDAPEEPDLAKSRRAGWDVFVRGGLFGLAFWGAWFAAEGLYVVLRDGTVPIWAAAFNLGVGAPLVLIGAVLAGILTLAWGFLAADLGGIDRVRRWFWDGPLAQRARRSAWLLAVPVFAACWFGVAVAAGDFVRGTVKTPAFGHLLIALVLLVAAVGLTLLAPLLVLPIAQIVGWTGRLFHRRLASPAMAVGIVATGAVVGLAVLWGQYPSVVPYLPWNFPLSFLSGMVTAGAVVWWASAEWRRSAMTTAGLAAVVVTVGIASAYLPVSLHRARAAVVEQPTVGGAWYGVVEQALDYDGDGALHIYAGNDCAPRDKSINPTVPEIAGNGVDENCSGGDLTVDMADFSSGKRSHPRPDGIADRPNIILVTTDALARAHTTGGGYGRDTTPRLAEWSQHATTFEHGFALGPGTRLALPELIAGVYNSLLPMQRGRIHPYSWDDGVETIATVLRHTGYDTVFVPGDNYFFPKHWGGLSNGFDTVDTSAYHTADDKTHTAPQVTKQALSYIRDHRDSDPPLFLWVHYYDHHGPYEQPGDSPVFGGDRPVDVYDNEVHFADHYWGRLFGAVSQTWSPREYLLIFTSDHGEDFDDNHPGSAHHGYHLRTHVLNVPFIVQGPARRGEHLQGLVSHADVLPTVANIVGVKPRRDWNGESLTPVLFDDQKVQKNALFSLFYIPEAIPRGRDGFWRFGLRTQQYSYVEDVREGTRRLIDWQRDPAEKNNLADKYPEILEMYRYVAAHKLEDLRHHERALTE